MNEGEIFDVANILWPICKNSIENNCSFMEKKKTVQNGNLSKESPYAPSITPEWKWNKWLHCEFYWL